MKGSDGEPRVTETVGEADNESIRIGLRDGRIVLKFNRGEFAMTLDAAKVVVAEIGRLIAEVEKK